MSDANVLKVGGPVDSSEHIYVKRASDDEFLQLIEAGEYVNVVTSRQMGKTSLVYRAMLELADQGYRFAYYDLSHVAHEESRRVYYQTVVQELAGEWSLPLDLADFWRRHAEVSLSQAFIDFFHEALEILDGRLVVVLDEIDSTLQRDFTDDLFTAIRGLYNARPRNAALKRLSFCLVGVATPNELIKARRTTPYNIGRTLWLADFDASRDDLTPLARALNSDPASAGQMLARILYWTGGQPYLTVKLCEEARNRQASTPEAIDVLVNEQFTSLEGLRHDPHFEQTLRFIHERVANSGEVIGLYERLLQGENPPDQAANLAYAQLKLSGLARRDAQGRLLPRNRLYEKLFNLAWVAASKPKKALARARRLAYGAVAMLFLGLVSGGLYYQFQIVPLEQEKQALQQREDARQQLERLQISLEQDLGGFTQVGLPAQDRANVFRRALPYLQTLASGREPSRMAFELQPEDGIALAQLAEWPGLARLVIRDPRIADIGPLAGMVGLRELDFALTAVSDLSPLAGLKELHSLSVAGTRVEDLAPLARLANLEVLELGNTRVSDLNPLSGLAKLRRLDLSNTPVADLTPLAGLAHLEELNLSRTQVRDLAPLRNLPALRHLALDGLGLRGFKSGKATVLEDPPALNGPPQAGQVFRDCPVCPQMVALPGGRFIMGSPESEKGHQDDEGPQHPVRIAPLAVARFETRFDEWALCVADGACPELDDAGFGRGARPAIRVSWDEARRYAQWLTKKSGLPYRLLSEAEWEYATRAGSRTAYAFGDDPDQLCIHGNVADESAKAEFKDWTIANCKDGHVYTAPAGLFQPNAFGLYDAIGNVWEWTEDCYHDSYQNAPKDGRPWITSNCDMRVARGGGWGDNPASARSANRSWSTTGSRDDSLGFRLARTLSP